MKNYLELQEKIKEYVTNLFNQYRGGDLYYHNLEHTQTVVKRTLEIASDYTFDEKEICILSAAGWFHDTGHLSGTPKLHEDRSVMIMKNFLKAYELEMAMMNRIESCICATKFPHNPKTLMDEIVCDADTYHLGTDDFLTSDELLKREMQLRNISIENWEENTLDLLLRHKYFTPYCQALLNEGKEENIDLIRYLLQEK